VLERRRGDPNDPLTHIGLAAHSDDPLAASDLQQTLKRLHTPVAVPTRHLDVEATVDRTARHAGLLQPVRQAHRRVPELVVLVEQHHAGDQIWLVWRASSRTGCVRPGSTSTATTIATAPGG